MTPDPTVTVDDLLASIRQLCEAYAKSEVNRALANLAQNGEQAKHHAAHAEYWEAATASQWQALAAVVGEALPSTVTTEDFLPIRSVTSGHVELHARDNTARSVVVLLTGAQALTVGAHLTAHGAVALDRIGAKVDAALTPIARSAPFVGTVPAGPPVVPGTPANP